MAKIKREGNNHCALCKHFDKGACTKWSIITHSKDYACQKFKINKKFKKYKY